MFSYHRTGQRVVQQCCSFISLNFRQSFKSTTKSHHARRDSSTTPRQYHNDTVSRPCHIQLNTSHSHSHEPITRIRRRSKVQESRDSNVSRHCNCERSQNPVSRVRYRNYTRRSIKQPPQTLPRPCCGRNIPPLNRSYRDWETDRKSTRLNSSHLKLSRMPSSA